jgi:transcriptional regulator with XRE-family HTH domain
MPLDIRIRFGRAIRRIREEQEINQEEAAKRCGLHWTYYRDRVRRQECVAREYRESGEGVEEEPARVIQSPMKLQTNSYFRSWPGKVPEQQRRASERARLD